MPQVCSRFRRVRCPTPWCGSSSPNRPIARSAWWPGTLTIVTDDRLYLASRSPRRHELLRQLGVAFDELRLREAPGRDPDIVEGPRDGESAPDYVKRIARTKANVGWERMTERGLPARPVLGADTEVVLDGHIFGKPADASHALEMLDRLNGRTHLLLTAVALRWEREV